MISQIESQLRDEVNRFKEEMTAVKEEYAKVYDQISQNAKKTAELRKSAEQQALLAAQER